MPAPSPLISPTTTPLLHPPPPPSPSRLPRFLLLLLPALLFLSVFLLSPPLLSPSTSSPLTLSSSRTAPYPDPISEIYTGDCSYRLQCRVRIFVRRSPHGDLLLLVGYLIRSADPSEERAVDRTTSRRVGEVTRHQADAWAADLFHAVEGSVTVDADEEYVVQKIADAIMRTKDIAKTCRRTDENECQPLVTVEPSPCVCPKIYRPVCGVNGKTFTNYCWAQCAHVDIKCIGKCPCPEDCGCPKVYDPVCGADGNVYENECLAMCYGVEAKCKGMCPCESR